MSGYLPPTEHARLEHAAVAALRRLGYEVKRTADGVEVSGPGFTLRARSARDLVADLVPADARLTRAG